MLKWLRQYGIALLMLAALLWGTVHLFRIMGAMHCSNGDLPASVLDFLTRAQAAALRGETSIAFDVPDVVLVVPEPYCDNSDPLIQSLGLRHACEDTLVSAASSNDDPILAAVTGDELLGHRRIIRIPGIEFGFFGQILNPGDVLDIEVLGVGDPAAIRLTVQGK